jgi:hypothetical protein
MALVNLRGAEYDNQMIRNFPQPDFVGLCRGARDFAHGKSAPTIGPVTQRPSFPSTSALSEWRVIRPEQRDQRPQADLSLLILELGTAKFRG